MKQNKLEQKLIQKQHKSTIQWVGYVLALPFGHGCLGTAFMALAELALAHLAMAIAPNLKLNLRKLFLFSFSFKENDKQKAKFSNECPQQSS